MSRRSLGWLLAFILLAQIFQTVRAEQEKVQNAPQKQQSLRPSIVLILADELVPRDMAGGNGKPESDRRGFHRLTATLLFAHLPEPHC